MCAAIFDLAALFRPNTIADREAGTRAQDGIGADATIDIDGIPGDQRAVVARHPGGAERAGAVDRRATADGASDINA